MAAKARLDPLWWKKNRPDALSNSAVQPAIDDFAKVTRSLEKSGNVAAYFKAVSKLKAAIAKDSQTLRKAKDKEGLKLLSELERLAHTQAKSKQGQLTLDSDLVASGLSGTAGSKVDDAPSGQDLTQIVNGGDRGWALIEKNKAVASAKSKTCQAMPKGSSQRDFTGWNTESFNWSGAARNENNIPAVSIKLEMQYEWGGHPPQGGGAFLNNCRLWVTDIRVPLGYTVDADLEVGKAYNSGSNKAPIGAIPLKVTVRVVTALDRTTKSWTINCHGSKKREVK